MSSISPSPTATTATSTATQTSSGGGGGLGSSSQSSLYLFTFLATLFVLLGVSFAIATRSYILRRRFRARVEEALLRGETFPGMDNYLGRLGYGHIEFDVGNMGANLRAGGGGRRAKVVKDFGPVPEMWEVQLGEGELNEEGKKGRAAIASWEAMEPVSLRFPCDKPPPPNLINATTTTSTTSSPAINPLLADLPPPPTFFPARWARFFSRSPSSSTPSVPPSSTPSTTARPPPISQEELLKSVRGKEAEISVLIKMPDQFEGRKREEGEVSSVELGWVRVWVEK